MSTPITQVARTRTGLCLALVLSSNVVGCSDSDPTPEATVPSPDVDAFVEKVRAGVGMPGIQTAVIKDGKLVWARSYGNAVAAPLPESAMTTDSILELASISKEFVAVAFMQQVEAGLVGLDDDIGNALPWPVRNPRFPDVPITWRMVLSHTSSLSDDPRIFDDFVLGTDSPVALGDFMRDLYTPGGRYYSDQTFFPARPGSSYQYSTTAVSLAAYAIELAVKQPFDEYVRERIFEPLGMQSTSYFLRDLPPELLAVGYTCDAYGVGFRCLLPGDPAGTVLEQQHSVPQYPALMLRTSATQYAKFMAMLMNDGRADGAAVLSPSSVEQLFEPLPVERDDGVEQGLVFFGIPEGESLSDLMWGHGGEDLGVAVAAFFDRGSGVGAVVLGNSQDSAWTTRAQMTRIVAKLVTEFR